MSNSDFDPADGPDRAAESETPDPTGDGDDDPPPLTGDDRVSFRSWLTDLTYAEVHAAIWGFALAGTATLTQSEVIGGLTVGILLFAFGGRVAVGKDAPVDGLSDQILQQIRRQPHYFIFGCLTGIVIGYLGLVLGVDLSALTPFIPG